MKLINIMPLCSLMFFLCSFTNKADHVEVNNDASSSDVLQTYDEMLGYLKGKNYNLENFKIESIYEKYAAAENMSQKTLNDNYNYYHTEYEYDSSYASGPILVRYNGTCSSVAATMANKFYAKYKYVNGITNYSVFESNLKYSMSMGYFPKQRVFKYSSPYTTSLYHFEKSGTESGKVQDIFSNSLNSMNIRNEVWYEASDCVKAVKDLANDSRGIKAQVIGITGHGLLAVGYIDFNYSYTETKNFLWIKKTETVYKTNTFIVVCDGWKDAYATPYSSRKEQDDCYSYIDADKRIQYAIGIEVFN